MAQWKKIIVSGSDALLNTLSVSNGASGSFSGSFFGDGAGLKGIPAGAKGAQGAQGVQGTQGTQASQGTQGVQGIQGTQGVQGTKGAQGTQGTQGIQGIAGSLTLSGTTNNGLITLNGSAPNTTVESNLKFDGSSLSVTGSVFTNAEIVSKSPNQLQYNYAAINQIRYAQGNYIPFTAQLPSSLLNTTNNTIVLHGAVDASNSFSIGYSGSGQATYSANQGSKFYNYNLGQTKPTISVRGNIQIDQQPLTDADTIFWNLLSGSNASVTLGGNRTLALSQVTTGDTGVLLVKQGTGTSYNLTLPAGSVIIGGGNYTTTTTSNGTDVVGFYYDGTNYYWSIPNGVTGPTGAKGEPGTQGAQGTTGMTSDYRAFSNQYFGNSVDEYTYYDGSNSLIRDYINNVEVTRLQSDGTMLFKGDVIAYSSTLSDERLKDNIFTINNALEKVLQLRGVEYDWNLGARIGQHDMGLIAQEVEKIIPQVVREREMPLMDDSGTIYKMIDYDKLIGLLIEAIKEQQLEIEEIKKRLNE